MIYKIKKGILLEYICEQPILIASEEAEPDIPYMKQLNETAGLYCRQLLDGVTFDQLNEFALDQYDGDPEQIKRDLMSFLLLLQEEGYLSIIQ